MPVFRLSERISFPPAHFAAPNGLLAVGGDLSEKRLLLAYQMGIFPWYSAGDPILWWSPDPRLVLYPDEIRVSRRLRRTIRQGKFSVTSDTVFERVIDACARIRTDESRETWIVGDMIAAYTHLFSLGYAHSVEIWYDNELAGGLYGVSLGGSFFGESMFSRVANASKVALVALCDYLSELRFDMIDCQVPTSHLVRLGAREISRKQFLATLAKSIKRPNIAGKWSVALKET